MSKKEIEDLLKKGAYGALMDDDNAAEEFCEEDIDHILQRRTRVIQIEAGVKGSTFAKASFNMSSNRSDINIDDPNFWQKWAKKVDLDLDEALNRVCISLSLHCFSFSLCGSPVWCFVSHAFCHIWGFIMFAKTFFFLVNA